MEQWSGSKLGKEYANTVYCHPTYLTSLQSALCKILSPPEVKSQLTGKHADAKKDWGQEEKGVTEDDMVGWTQMDMSLRKRWETVKDREA